MNNLLVFFLSLNILRLLPRRIHALGSRHRAEEHPSSRAIMYEEKEYNIRKIKVSSISMKNLLCLDEY